VPNTQFACRGCGAPVGDSPKCEYCGTALNHGVAGRTPGASPKAPHSALPLRDVFPPPPMPAGVPPTSASHNVTRPGVASHGRTPHIVVHNGITTINGGRTPGRRAARTMSTGCVIVFILICVSIMGSMVIGAIGLFGGALGFGGGSDFIANLQMEVERENAARAEAERDDAEREAQENDISSGDDSLGGTPGGEAYDDNGYDHGLSNGAYPRDFSGVGTTVYVSSFRVTVDDVFIVDYSDSWWSPDSGNMFLGFSFIVENITADAHSMLMLDFQTYVNGFLVPQSINGGMVVEDITGIPFLVWESLSGGRSAHVQYAIEVSLETAAVELVVSYLTERATVYISLGT